PARPLTHDLLKAMLESVDAVVTRVEITDLREGTFYGKVYVLRNDVEETEFDARPSDAIALAVRFQAPILVARKVFDEAAVAVREKREYGGEEAGEDLEEASSAAEGKSEGKALSPGDALKAALDAAVRDE